MQAGLAWWGEISPFSPYGPSAALAFVLFAAAVKAIVGDVKRHAEDRRTNNSKCTKIEPDGAQSIHARWPLCKVYTSVLLLIFLLLWAFSCCSSLPCVLEHCCALLGLSLWYVWRKRRQDSSVLQGMVAGKRSRYAGAASKLAICSKCKMASCSRQTCCACTVRCQSESATSQP